MIFSYLLVTHALCFLSKNEIHYKYKQYYFLSFVHLWIAFSLYVFDLNILIVIENLYITLRKKILILFFIFLKKNDCRLINKFHFLH